MPQRVSRRESEPLISLAEPRRCHVVGIGGPGMSPLALVLASAGHIVTGSDMQESAVTQQLRSHGVAVFIGHNAERVSGADVVVYSTAIPHDNVELVEAHRRGVPVRHRSGLLASLCASHRSVGVAGTHGKTTTSALLVHMLTAAGLQPSSIVGAEVAGQGIGATSGNGDLLVLEADESDGTLDVLPLDSVIVTNVDVDHLDYFGSFEDVQSCFADVVERCNGVVVLNHDDVHSRDIVKKNSNRANCFTFGFDPNATVRITAWSPTDAGINVELEVVGKGLTCALPLRGQHNAYNLAAAIAMAIGMGVDPQKACEAVADFPGVSRRFTERGNFHGAVLIDDYAHLPAEISAAISAARTHPLCSGKVVAVFQPNRFHRIAAMADAYADCFHDADVVVITDVYASGTQRIEGVTGELVVNAIRASHPRAEIVWAPTRADIVTAVAGVLAHGDVCISMGCGDIETFPDDLKEASA
jgi:UDP-N-acetylmuramate--alanine ligase